jgi:hypothetical protein
MAHLVLEEQQELVAHVARLRVHKYIILGEEDFIHVDSVAAGKFARATNLLAPRLWFAYDEQLCLLGRERCQHGKPVQMKHGNVRDHREAGEAPGETGDEGLEARRVAVQQYDFVLESRRGWGRGRTDLHGGACGRLGRMGCERGEDTGELRSECGGLVQG